MIRRLLCACVGAALVGALAAPAYIVAKPPDLPEDGTFTATPNATPPSRPSAAGFLPFGNPLNFIAFRQFAQGARDLQDWLSFVQQLNPSTAHSQTGSNDDVLDMPRPIGSAISFRSFVAVDEEVIYDRDWLHWLIVHCTSRQPPPPPEQNDGYVHPISTGVDFALQVVGDLPDSREEKQLPTIEVLPIPQEVPDVTCPYLRQKMIDRQSCQLADPDMGRNVLDNLKRLKRADKLLDGAKELARAGLISEAMECCARAAELCPGSPCAKRAADTMIDLALGFVMPSSASEEDSEPQTDGEIAPEKKSPAIDYEFEVGANTDGGVHLCADCSLSGNVYHLRYKHGCLSIWKTSDGGKTKP